MIWSSRARQIVLINRLVLLRSHRPLRCTEIMVRSEDPKIKLQGWGLKLPFPAISNASAPEKQNPAQSLRGLFTDD